jgi:hypothetical protein
MRHIKPIDMLVPDAVHREIPRIFWWNPVLKRTSEVEMD